MRVLESPAARATILRRAPPGEPRLPPQVRARIRQAFGQALSPRRVVDRVEAEVRRKGDEALRDLTCRLDGVDIAELGVPPEEMRRAEGQVSRDLLLALKKASLRIAAYHDRFRPRRPLELRGGVGRVVRPLARVGIYVPGNYASTVLMTAIPARVAGVKQVVVVSPPQKDGSLPPAVLAACSLAGIGRVFRVGGAQAIFALAYGTETVPAVDKVCGPGGLFVQMAKRQVYGLVDIDGLYGPTEALLLADDSADPVVLARELLAQAEHDPLAVAILLTPSRPLAQRVSREVGRLVPQQERGQIIRQALARQGGIVLVRDLEEGVELINSFAPEHCALFLQDPWPWAQRIEKAGGLFLGPQECLGDYLAGPSHVMPTGGTARYASPLGVEAFLKYTSLVALEEGEASRLAPLAATLARAEGLTAHARALEGT